MKIYSVCIGEAGIPTLKTHTSLHTQLQCDVIASCACSQL